MLQKKIISCQLSHKIKFDILNNHFIWAESHISVMYFCNGQRECKHMTMATGQRRIWPYLFLHSKSKPIYNRVSNEYEFKKIMKYSIACSPAGGYGYCGSHFISRIAKL